MIRHFCICCCLALVSAATPMRAANRPHAGADGNTKVVWTNDDLDKLHNLDLISIVGRDDEKPALVPMLAEYQKTRDAEWYSEQVAKLRDELEYRQAQLRNYQQALDDARSLNQSTSGIDLVDESFAITPEAGIEILRQRVSQTQSELDALEDLARRNDIEPGTLRGQ